MTDKNPPAFPAQMVSSDGNTTVTDCYSGMSLRDWFAGQALVKLDIGDAIEDCLERLGLDQPTKEVRCCAREMVARNAYEIADAMLEARR